MRHLILVAGLSITLISNVFSQSTQTSGNWNDPSIWSGGSVPAASGTVNVNNPTVIDGNLSPTGNWTFSSNATDQPGGTAYTFNPNAGTNTIKVDSNETVTFEGGTSGTPNAFSSGTIDIYGTMILGYTQLNNSGNLNITIEPSGTLIIYGDLTNKNNSGTFTVNGALIVYGDFANNTGSVTVGGSGTINTTGKITTTGGSTVFGSTNDCNTGPCSGTTLTCSFTNTISPASKTICTGTTAGTLTSTNSASTPTYQWLSSTDNVTYANASGVSTSSSYITPTLTQATWYKLKVTSSGGCTSTTAAVKVTVLSSGGWTGATSTSWGTASNWCSLSVPTSTTDVTITNSASISNMPTINGGTSASCRNLTISSTYPVSTVTIAASASASLNIYGDLTNNGTLTDNSTAATAGVIMKGSTAQAITGSSAMVFNNLTVDNSLGASPAINISTNNLTVNNNLTMMAGIISLNGTTFTLGNSAASTGTLSYAAGTWMYGGNIVRWFPTTAVALGANASLFPIGTISYYRPMYFGSAGLSAAGSIKVSHTPFTTATAVSFPDGASTVSIRSDSYWTVTTANGLSGTGTPFDVRTYATGMGVVGSVSDLRLTLVASAAPGTTGANSGTISNPQVNRTGFSVANLSNNFYWGSVNPGMTTLAVNLLSFSGQQQSGSVVLNWQAALDGNHRIFSIERSTDGASFVEIGEVPVVGNSASGYSYSYTDQRPVNGKNYYRLKIAGLDGAFTYSRIVSIYLMEDNKFVVFPNPSDGHSINVQIAQSSQSPGAIDVFNDLGILVGHAYATSPVFPVYFTPGLSPGVYFARYSSQGRNVVKTFVVKK